MLSSLSASSFLLLDVIFSFSKVSYLISPSHLQIPSTVSQRPPDDRRTAKGLQNTGYGAESSKESNCQSCEKKVGTSENNKVQLPALSYLIDRSLTVCEKMEGETVLDVNAFESGSSFVHRFFVTSLNLRREVASDLSWCVLIE